MASETADRESETRDEIASVSPPSLVRRTGSVGYALLALLALQAITGLLLMLRYRPHPEHAWLDVLDLRQTGGWSGLYELHFWAARAVLVLVVIHLLGRALNRYRHHRRFSGWTLGVLLLALTIAWTWTGDALVDPLEVGGNAQSEATRLLWIYVLHVAILPLLAAWPIAAHLRRTGRDRQSDSTGEES